MLSPDFLQQLGHDRQQELQATADANRLAASAPTRVRVARTLRRAADRLDTTPHRGTQVVAQR